MSRMIDNGKIPKLSLNIDARFYDEDRKAYNTIAEIPGSDENPEIVGMPVMVLKIMVLALPCLWKQFVFFKH
ncbi:MAG: hypothetical protein QMC62_15065 [Alteromonadaceae bacterium]